MFGRLKKSLWEKRLDKEQVAFDKEKAEYKTSCLYGKWENGRRVYANGCYCVPFEKIEDDWKVKLYSKNGNELCECKMGNIHDMTYGFIKVTNPYTYSASTVLYDGIGNSICNGISVFITNEKELGKNLCLIPASPCESHKMYAIYNHKTMKFVTNDYGNYMLFDGIKGEDGKIVCVINGAIDYSGYGTLRNTSYCDLVYILDYDGNICDSYQENFRSDKNET